MKQKIMIAVVVAAIVALPASTFAATYGYINASGVFATVTANNATEALRTPDIHAKSGVILLSPTKPLTLTVGTKVPVATTTVKTATTSALSATSASMTATSTMSTGTSTSSTATTTATSTTI